MFITNNHPNSRYLSDSVVAIARLLVGVWHILDHLRTVIVAYKDSEIALRRGDSGNTFRIFWFWCTPHKLFTSLPDVNSIGLFWLNMIAEFDLRTLQSHTPSHLTLWRLCFCFCFCSRFRWHIQCGSGVQLKRQRQLVRRSRNHPYRAWLWGRSGRVHGGEYGGIGYRGVEAPSGGLSDHLPVLPLGASQDWWHCLGPFSELCVYCVHVTHAGTSVLCATHNDQMFLSHIIQRCLYEDNAVLKCIVISTLWMRISQKEINLYGPVFYHLIIC